jgi:hypothetical protein
MQCSQVEIEIERTLYKFLRSGQPRVMQLALFHSDIIMHFHSACMNHIGSHYGDWVV